MDINNYTRQQMKNLGDVENLDSVEEKGDSSSDYEKDDDEADKFYVIEPDYVGGLYNYMMENYYSNSVNMNFKVAYAIRQNCQSFFDRSREFMIDLEIYNQISEKYVYYFAGLMYKRWLNSYDYLSDILKNELKD